MMKKLFIAILSVISSLPTLAQYKIVGDVEGIEDGTLLYLTLVKSEHVNIDSTTIKNGHFEFTGGKQQRPHWALIKRKGAFVAVCDFYLENGNITIKGGQYSAKATGTPTNAEYDEYQTDINAMGNTIYSLRVNIGMEQDAQRQDSLKQVLKATEQLQRTKEMNFIRRYPNSPISQRIAGYLAPSMAAAEALDMLKMLSEEIQQSDEMQQVKKRAEQLAKVEAGAVAPNFTLPTENGSILSLSDYKGKYVLIVGLHGAVPVVPVSQLSPNFMISMPVS